VAWIFLLSDARILFVAKLDSSTRRFVL